MAMDANLKKIRVGVIGAGHLGQHHIRIYAGMDGVELSGICDTDMGRARSLARKYKTNAFSDYRQMFGMIDCASVVVPTELHFAVTKDLLENGISVLIEKPMAKSVEEAEGLLSTARQKGLITQVGHIERFNAAVMALDEIPGKCPFHRMPPPRAF